MRKRFKWKMERTSTEKKALKEFSILEDMDKTFLILPYKKQIMKIVRKFSLSGQSGGSAPIVANSISKAVKGLCLHEPLSSLSGADVEWGEPIVRDGVKVYQNNRCFGLFKSDWEKPYYIDSIVFRDVDEEHYFTGMVGGISSTNYVKFPFFPRKFYIDVRRVKNEKTGVTENVLVDEKQLDEVWRYYEKRG